MQRVFGPHHARANHELQGASDPDQPSQALRAAAAGQNPEFHLREPEPIVAGLPDAQVARQAQLEPTAHRVAVHRHDDRFGQVPQILQHGVIGGGKRRTGLPHGLAVFRQIDQFLHAVVRDELPFQGAGQHHGPNGRVAPLLDTLPQFLRALGTEIIHRRVVILGHDDTVALFGLPIAHVGSPV